MSVPRPDPPQEIKNALIAGLPLFLNTHDDLFAILTGSQHGDVEALQGFAADLTALAAGSLQTRPASWRFFAADSLNRGIIVTVRPQDSAHPARIGAVQRGSQAAKFIQAVRAVDVPSGAPPIGLTLKLLNVPALLTQLFWIKPPSGDGWVIPEQTQVTEFGHQVLTVADFIIKAQPKAADRLQMHDE